MIRIFCDEEEDRGGGIGHSSSLMTKQSPGLNCGRGQLSSQAGSSPLLPSEKKQETMIVLFLTKLDNVFAI